jgi:hypothetical protein
MNLSATLLKALGVTAELTNTELSKDALKVMALDLSAYPEPMVLAALDRVRREVRGRMTVADVVTRLEDGRPGPEEAWAMIPKDEHGSVVWTGEMALAFGVAEPLMDTNRVQARLAFIEAYNTAVRRERDAKRPPRWFASMGRDPNGREAAVQEAIDKGRITQEHAQTLLPVRVSPELHRQLEVRR